MVYNVTLRLKGGVLDDSNNTNSSDTDWPGRWWSKRQVDVFTKRRSTELHSCKERLSVVVLMPAWHWRRNLELL